MKTKIKSEKIYRRIEPPVTTNDIKETQIYNSGSMIGGMKDNLTKQDKPSYHLMVPQFITAISKVLTNGAKKYAPHNWEKGISYSEVYRALIGHLNDWYSGKERDHEWNFSHLAHAGCCLMFLFWYSVCCPERYREFDDRTFTNPENDE